MGERRTAFSDLQGSYNKIELAYLVVIFIWFNTQGRQDETLLFFICYFHTGQFEDCTSIYMMFPVPEGRVTNRTLIC